MFGTNPNYDVKCTAFPIPSVLSYPGPFHSLNGTKSQNDKLREINKLPLFSQKSQKFFRNLPLCCIFYLFNNIRKFVTHFRVLFIISDRHVSGISHKIMIQNVEFIFRPAPFGKVLFWSSKSDSDYATKMRRISQSFRPSLSWHIPLTYKMIQNRSSRLIAL